MKRRSPIPGILLLVALTGVLALGIANGIHRYFEEIERT